MTETPIEPTVVPSSEGPQPQIFDYWGTDETHRWNFPDGVQWIDIKVMDEGDRAKFERLTSQDLRVDQRSQQAIMKLDTARDRHSLIEAAVVNWKMYRKIHKGENAGQLEEVRFTREKLTDWLGHADPRHVDDLSMFIRRHNSWLHGEMTIEQVDQEIDRLRGVRDDLEKRESGKGDS